MKEMVFFCLGTFKKWFFLLNSANMDPDHSPDICYFSDLWSCTRYIMSFPNELTYNIGTIWKLLISAFKWCRYRVFIELRQVATLLIECCRKKNETFRNNAPKIKSANEAKHFDFMKFAKIAAKSGLYLWISNTELKDLWKNKKILRLELTPTRIGLSPSPLH